MKEIFDYLGMDWIIVLLYTCAGFYVTSFWKDDLAIPFTTKKVTVAWKTLILGSIIVLLYVFIDKGPYGKISRVDWKTIFITYVFTTSMYELFIKETVGVWIRDLLNRLKSKQ